MNKHADFIDDPVLPTAKPGSVKTFRQMLDEAVITARSGDTEYAHEVLDVVMTHLGRRISEAWNHGHQTGHEELENDQERRAAYHDQRVEWARQAEAKEWQRRQAEELEARDAESKEMQNRITELETDLDLALFHRDTDHMAAIRSLEERLERARRHASFLRGELYRERAQRETAQDYRRTAVWSAIADVLATKASDLDVAEEWADEAMDAVVRTLPDAEEDDRG